MLPLFQEKLGSILTEQAHYCPNKLGLCKE
jgi:hypothetical protein